MSPVADNLARVRDRIHAAAARAGRDPGEVSLCAVTKMAELPAIREAVAAGVRILGENRVQAAEAKISEAEDLAGVVSWHLIGHLQSNKARRAVELFDEIQSLDGRKLARRLSSLGEERGRPIPVLAEVRTGEESKGGFEEAEAADAVPEIADLPGLELRGLMTMAPFTDVEREVRAAFVRLRELRDRLGGAARLPVLSMGMTNDFEIAVEEGATLVRIGTAIFG